MFLSYNSDDVPLLGAHDQYRSTFLTGTNTNPCSRSLDMLTVPEKAIMFGSGLNCEPNRQPVVPSHPSALPRLKVMGSDPRFAHFSGFRLTGSKNPFSKEQLFFHLTVVRGPPPTGPCKRGHPSYAICIHNTLDGRPCSCFSSPFACVCCVV